MTRLATPLLLLSTSIALASPTQLRLVSRGGLQVPAAGTTAPGGLDTLVPSHPEVDLHAYLSGGPTPDHPLPTSIPDAPNSGLSLWDNGFSGFDGLDHADQRLAGTGVYTNTQFSLEPPDQGLCVGNGFVVETVNTAFAIYDRQGKLLAGPVPANQFFGLAPEIDRTTGLSGDFTSDPRCIFDWTSNRFYITILQLDVDPATGGFTGPSHTLIAVSRTGNPTGAWDAYSLDTTNDGTNGTPSHPGCPCFGDQPLLGFDEHAIFISNNEFPVFVNGFNGAQVYGIGKDAFGGNGSVVLFDNLSLEEGIAYSVQPASTPPSGKFERSSRGTEFFASSLEFTGGLDDRIAVWAMTGTKTLNGQHPKVDFGYRIVSTLPYGVPPAGTQKDGPTPLRDSLIALGFDEKLEEIESNDDRMQQAVYTDGTLWASLPTIVKPKGDSTYRAGALWFRIDTSIDDGRFKARLKRQGYLARKATDILFPSVAVNRSGAGAIGFSITGPTMWPSAGYVLLDDDGTGPIHVAAAGAAPEDGFTGYTAFGGDGAARWGDYSAAVAAPDGSIWLAAEYITPRPRTVNANWGTFVTRLKIRGCDDDDHDHGHDH